MWVEGSVAVHLCVYALLVCVCVFLCQMHLYVTIYIHACECLYLCGHFLPCLVVFSWVSTVYVSILM